SEERTLPGSFPFVRGTDGERDVTVGWHVDAAYGRGGDTPDAVNEHILEGLANGVSALTLSVGDGALAPADLPTALKGVYLDLAPVSLDAGQDAADASRALLALLDEAEVHDRGTVRIRLGLAPLTDLFAGRGETVTAGDLIDLARHAAE